MNSDPCASKSDEMYTSQRATMWHFSCSITWPNLPCLPRPWIMCHYFSESKIPLRFSNNILLNWSINRIFTKYISLAAHRITFLFACLLLFLFRCYTVILVYRTMVHMWNWFHDKLGKHAPFFIVQNSDM